MSHFSVLVITPTKPDEEGLQEILLPWHEYECTGIDKYLVDVDVTDKVIAEFDAPQKVVVLADGKVMSRWDDAFYDDKEFKLSDGAVEREMTAEEARTHGIGYATLAAAAEEYYGERVIERDGRFHYRTNSNKKWDWWQIGGRYAGRFAPDYDPNEDPANKERCWLCNGTGTRTDGKSGAGCNGCNGTGIMTKWPTEWKAIGSQVMVRDVPLEALRNIAEHEALKVHDAALAIVAGRPIPDWDVIRNGGIPIAEARDRFNNDQVVKDLRNEFRDLLFYEAKFLAGLKRTRVEVARQARQQAIQSFAVVKDGRWYELGEMGWWGIVHDEKDEDKWSEEFNALLDALPETT